MWTEILRLEFIYFFILFIYFSVFFLLFTVKWMKWNKQKHIVALLVLFQRRVNTCRQTDILTGMYIHTNVLTNMFFKLMRFTFVLLQIRMCKCLCACVSVSENWHESRHNRMFAKLLNISGRYSIDLIIQSFTHSANSHVRSSIRPSVRL